MEYCSGGSVTDLSMGLKKLEGRHLSELEIAYILLEVIDGLIHLHSNNIIHRDVKGHNILLTGEGRIKLIDFGVSAQLSDQFGKRNTSVGTPYWMPPEVIACERQNNSSYDARCDVWSLGITAIELVDGEPPLADLHPMRALFQIPRNPPPTVSRPGDSSPLLNDFIAECLIKNIECRPLSAELKAHPLLLSVPPSTDRIRSSLLSSVELVRAGGRMRREPEVTTKHGRLKTERRGKLQTMYLDDLASLSSLDEETILEQLYQRFEQKNIYTYIGNILLAINPYEELGIYTDFYQFKYRGTSTADLSPHIFGMADQAYHSMLHNKTGQTFVITGESGSGKTESAKYLLQQLVYLGKAPNRNLEIKILQVNPIMEAFGNAGTGINANSSRFGKYLNLTFTKTGKITGAEISVYLLEESRVTHHVLGETCFHIFYYVLHGLKNSEKFSGLFKESFNYLHKIENNPAIEAANVLNFKEIDHGLTLLGFLNEELSSIYEILIGILHIGEIEFDHDTKDGGSVCVANLNELEIVSKLLGVSAGDLGVGLTSRTVVASGESFVRRNTLKEALTIRDSLARGLYNRLFQWIVHQINALLGISRAAYGQPLSIAILDIFGFESHSANSLEQFCINVTNEQLQFYFNQSIFSWEQQEYMAEGIDIELIHYADNKPILELVLGRPLGIFTLLDEESHFPQGSDWTLQEKLNKNFVHNKYYRKSKSSADLAFEIRHYAGRVRYCLKNFLVKNRSWNSTELIEILRNSKNDTVRHVFRCLLTKTGHLYAGNRRKSLLNPAELKGLASQTRSQQTVSSQFRHSLTELMGKLLHSEPHFVRCIKPNLTSSPKTFDLIKVLDQLRYSGILECVHIRQTGFSHRYTFVNFLKNYCFLAFNFDERVVADRETCRLLLLRLKLDGWAVGKTKVFLKYYHVEFLAKLSELQIRRIIFVQSCIRRWLTKIRLRRGMWMVANQIVSAQKAAKVWKRLPSKNSGVYRRKADKKRSSWLRVQVLGIDEVGEEEKTEEEKAAILIQSHFRGFVVRKKWGPVLEERIKQIVTTHKSAETAKTALRDEGLDEEEAAQVLQRYYRRWKITREKSVDNENENRDEIKSPVEEWDAPFRLIESRMRETRAGRKRSEKVDMAAHRKDMIKTGLASQEFENEERDKKVARGWQKVIETASCESEELKIVPPGRKMSKFGKHLLTEALESKILELRKTSPSTSQNSPIVVANKNVRVKSFEIEPSENPVDFRKLLRKTGKYPAENLK